MSREKSIPSVSVTYARTGNSTRPNELGIRPMQERAYEKRGEQYLLSKALPASGKSRALMFIALDKLDNQGLAQAVIAVPERTIGARFNRASASPRDGNGTVKRFHEWSLAQFIDVACEIGMLKPDVKKFSHGLRDFRNHIHPYEQMVSDFTLDAHRAKVCFQVLKAALASVVGERS